MGAPVTPSTEIGQLLAVPLAHRGLHGAGVPENSLAAFRYAVQRGIGIEMDVRLSADGIPVVHHDPTLDRMCNATGPVGARRAVDLTRLRLSGTEERLPSLAAALHEIAGAVPVLVDLKAGLGRTERRRLVAAVATLVRSYRGPIGVVGFDPWLLNGMASEAPRVARGQSGGLDPALFAAEGLGRIVCHPIDSLWTMRVSRPHFVSFNVARMPSAALSRVRESHPVVAWTVRTRADYQLAVDCADAVIVEDAAVDLALGAA